MQEKREREEAAPFEIVPGPEHINPRLFEKVIRHSQAIQMLVNEPASYFGQDLRDSDIYSLYLKPGWQFADRRTYISHASIEEIIRALSLGCQELSADWCRDQEELMRIEKALGQLSLSLDEEEL